VIELAQAYTVLVRETYPEAKKIAVGQDCRLTSPQYAQALIQTLCEAGFEVFDLGICPTPLTYFSTHFYQLDGAIMITGSHNEAKYNGFKICVGKDTIFGAQLQKIKKTLEQKAFHPARPGGSVKKIDVINAYIETISKTFSAFPKKKVVVDAGNATAATVAPILLRKLGLDVIELYCELDGRFPHHHPDPTMPENLRDLQKAVLEHKADFGLAFDGDADRLGAVDEKGGIFFGDDLMILFSRSILKDKKNAVIISEVKSSNRLYNDIKKNGGIGLMWKTGHSLIKAKMKETQASLAGEMSGHIFFADRYYGYDDGIYAAARFAEIACHATVSASELLKDLPIVYNTPEIRLDCPDHHKFELVEKTKQLLKQYPCVDIDGVRVNFDDGWGLVRASNTQPSLVLRFEALTQNRLQEIQALVQDAIIQAAKQLDIGKPVFQ
jgi:phosphomannomutase/phosphoglucomutase